MGPMFFSPGDSHTKELHFMFHPGLEGVAEVDTDPKRRFVVVKVTPSNGRVLCVYALPILVLKGMLDHFLKFLLLNKILEFPDWKRDYKFFY